MSDALFSGSKIALRLPKEKSETELTTHSGNYSRRMKAGDTASECVLKANDDEKKEKDDDACIGLRYRQNQNRLSGAVCLSKIHRRRQAYKRYYLPVTCGKKWVRELYETVPNCIARVVSSITDIDRMYELYKTSDKPVFMVLSKESARSGYLRKPTVMWNKRRKGFICPVCGAVQEMTVTTDSTSYTVPADSIFAL